MDDKNFDFNALGIPNLEQTLASVNQVVAGLGTSAAKNNGTDNKHTFDKADGAHPHSNPLAHLLPN
jgi:hypothetical protein